MMKARENRAFIVRDNSLGQDWEIMTDRKGLQHDLVRSLAKTRPRMSGARSSGVTGTPWPRLAPVFTGAMPLWRDAVTAM
jgi:hypothetical protein